MWYQIIIASVILFPVNLFGEKTQQEIDQENMQNLVDLILDDSSDQRLNFFQKNSRLLINFDNSSHAPILSAKLINAIKSSIESNNLAHLKKLREHLSSSNRYDLFIRALNEMDRAKVAEILRSNKEIKIWWDEAIGETAETLKSEKPIQTFIEKTQQFLNEDFELQRKIEDLRKRKEVTTRVDGERAALLERYKIKDPIPVAPAAPDFHQFVSRSISNNLKPITYVLASAFFAWNMKIFYAQRHIEETIRQKKGWMYWRTTMSLKDIRSSSAQNFMTLLLPDMVKRSGTRRLFEGEDKMCAKFLDEIESEMKELEGYVFRAKRIDSLRLSMIFGIDETMVAKAKDGLQRLKAIQENVVRYVLELKMAERKNAQRVAAQNVQKI